MQTDIEEKRYACENCGSEIKWMKDSDLVKKENDEI